MRSSLNELESKLIKSVRVGIAYDSPEKKKLYKKL